MLLLVFLIPIIACIILAIFFKEKVVKWEYAIVFFPSILLSLIVYFIMKYSSVTDIEYLGHYVSKIEYYEEWNEYIHQTCTREWTDGDGNTHIETYDCSYVQTHDEQFIIYDEAGKSYHTNHKTYNDVVRHLASGKIFVDMHRHYHTKDGDMYKTVFDGNRNHLHPFVIQNTYINKIIGSKSVFNFSEVSKTEFIENGLYDYPKINGYNYYDQNPIIGYDASTAVVDSFKYLNAYYGMAYQFRCYVMVFHNKDISISYKEKDFLVGGNKNELIVCLSVNDDNDIQWVNAFSWEDKPEIAIGTNYLFTSGEKLDLMKLNRYLLSTVPEKWHRKQFSDFDYIKINLNIRHWVWLFIITIIINIGLSLYVILNNIDNNTHYYNSFY